MNVPSWRFVHEGSTRKRRAFFYDYTKQTFDMPLIFYAFYCEVTSWLTASMRSPIHRITSPHIANSCSSVRSRLA